MKLRKLTAIAAAFLVAAYTAAASELPDKSNAYTVADDGLIFDTSVSEYSQTGEWSQSGVGFMEREKRTASAKDSSAKWSGVRPGDNGYYEIYIWKNVVENGDKNILVNWFATGSSNGKSVMDCSEGESGWQYLGTCNTSDLVFELSVQPSGDGIAPVCCFRMVRTDKEAYVNYLANLQNNVIVLKIGADKAYVNQNLINMDAGRAVINNSRTMVPLRFIMQNFGAKVDWDETQRKAEITLNDQKAEFYIGNQNFVLNGELKPLDSPAYISGERTMIPIRVLSESFGKKVYWDDSGIVVIAQNEMSDYSTFIKQGGNL